ncbi:carbon-nitrogen hydrolase family protein [Myxococcus qinghaiensis]|uniref:carbon-nitrogen hydrolase family protein n=1 Tax=Myxococcus qinghaiensis TaxID=2906758 RepID=UPI0020A6FA14|nr:carbon-nitrogen hydrolase family protein [Myxococcus qinghaiensis]MCP3163113.1 carbon-nitrogen hydrolase family protein [Myxococcus qinghaiensis]
MNDALPPTHVELFALQPRVSLEDYASPASFTAKHRALAERIHGLRARDTSGNPLHPALAVWPELVGAPLGMMGHLPQVRRHSTTRGAMRRVALAEWGPMWRAWRDLQPPTREECLYAALASRVHRVMHETFSGIARDFGLWVVAGSALLPDNRRRLGAPDFEPRGARTYNTGHTFNPEGHCVAVTRKVNLVPGREDVLHLSPGRPEDLTVLATPFGRLGTLLGYDAFRKPHTAKEPWFVPCAQYLDALRADILAHPSANPWPWDAPWPFESTGASPRTGSEHWFEEGLPSQLPTMRRVRYTVTAQLVGDLLDNHFEAPSLILERTDEGRPRVLARSENPRDEDVLHVIVPACTA